MKKSLFNLIGALVFISGMSTSLAFASDDLTTEDSTKSDFSFNLNADFVSRYVWRGLPLSLNPNIQPYASLDYKNLSLGIWSSYAISEPYAEVDIYLTYSPGPFTIGVYDYFNEDEPDMIANDYFQFKDKDSTSTLHSVEAWVSFNGIEKVPLSFTVATFIWGNDKDSLGENYYSTYLELGYSLAFKDFNFDFFVGGTVAEGYYADEAAIVNVGLTASKEIPITQKFSIPISGSFIINPHARDVFLVLSLTL